MDFVLGLVAGIFLTILVAAIGIWYFLHNAPPPTLPSVSPASAGQPVMVTRLTEALINRVLAESLDAQAEPVPVVGPFKFKLHGMGIHVHLERRAEIIADISVSTGPLKLALQPISEILLEHNAARVRIYVVSLQLAGVTIPRVWVDRFVQDIVAGAEKTMNTVLEQMQTEMGVVLFDLNTDEQEVILKFK